MKFLERLADHLSRKYGDDLSSVCVVLPNRRGGLFLKKYLAEKLRKISWLPAVFSVEDFMLRLSDLKPADPQLLLFELYAAHRAIEGDKALPFIDFMGWGQQVLQDFNEIDTWQTDAEALFGYLTESRVLAVWNLEQKPLTAFEKEYLAFYRGLFPLYTGLRQRLARQGWGYPGMIFREVPATLQRKIGELEWKTVVFAGFNALTPTEESVIGLLREAGRADILWDADRYYLEDERQEAGEFLRKWIRRREYQPFQWIENGLLDRERRIRLTGAASDIGQVKACGEILRSWKAEGIPEEEMAVVLMDEKLLLPLLNSIPEEIGELNITMGLPLKNTPLCGLADALVSMHERSESRTASGYGGNYYFRDLLAVLQHPHILHAASVRNQQTRQALETVNLELRKGNRIFLDPRRPFPVIPATENGLLDFLKPILQPATAPAGLLAAFEALINELRATFSSDNARDRAGLEILVVFSGIVDRLQGLMADRTVVADIRTLAQLFRQMTGAAVIPFYGEPLRGVQIMGTLETRTLDFRHVIMLSVNEDILPSGRSSASLIPFDLRIDFGLPTFRRKNAVYAYHFYRLLQRAETAAILYATEPTELGGGEPSRFLKQILAEFPSSAARTVFEEQILAVPSTHGRIAQRIRIVKTPVILEKISARAAAGFSPSSLNRYRRCPLLFYLMEVAGLREQDEAEETIDARTFGNAVHKTLETLYAPLEGRPLRQDDTGRMLRELENMLTLAFREEYSSSDLAFGKNLLWVSMARMILEKYLRSEEESLRNPESGQPQREVYGVEMEFAKEVTVRAAGQELPVRIRGKADRIDRIGAKRWRIVDYKTGAVKPAALKIGDWNDLAGGMENQVAFQLLAYAFLLSDTAGPHAEIESGVVLLKKTGLGFLPVTVPGGKGEVLGREELAAFKSILAQLVGEILDPEFPFEQTPDEENCDRCPFLEICNR